VNRIESKLFWQIGVH